MKNKMVLFIFIIIYAISNAQYEKLSSMEKVIFGFNLSDSRSFDDRLTTIEMRVLGIKSNKTMEERESDLYNYIYIDGKRYSILTKIGNAEEFLYKKRDINKDLLSRIERIETNVFKRIYNDKIISERVKNIYAQLAIKDSDFLLKGSFPGLKEPVRIKPEKRYFNLKKGDILNFRLLDEIEGVAAVGDKVLARVTELNPAADFKDEEVVITFIKIINSDNVEYDIYKEMKLKANNKNVTGLFDIIEGDKVEIKGVYTLE